MFGIELVGVQRDVVHLSTTLQCSQLMGWESGLLHFLHTAAAPNLELINSSFQKQLLGS